MRVVAVRGVPGVRGVSRVRAVTCVVVAGVRAMPMMRAPTRGHLVVRVGAVSGARVGRVVPAGVRLLVSVTAVLCASQVVASTCSLTARQ